MTVQRTADGAIRLDGDCSVDDAEPLLALLTANPEAVVDWSHCIRAHTAVVQVLLAARPALRGEPQDAFLRRHIARLLARQ